MVVEEVEVMETVLQVVKLIAEGEGMVKLVSEAVVEVILVVDGGVSGGEVSEIYQVELNINIF